MADLTVANADSESETALPERPDRDGRGRWLRGNTAGWPKGVSGNPSGKSSLRRHLQEIGEQTEDGCDVTRSELLAREIWQQALHGKVPLLRRSAWMLLTERFFPVTKLSEQHRFALNVSDIRVQDERADSLFADRVKELGNNSVGVLKALELDERKDGTNAGTNATTDGTIETGSADVALEPTDDHVHGTAVGSEGRNAATTRKD